VLLDRYEVLARIGSGGMGSVYVGLQRSVGRRVALKVLRADLVNNDHIRQRFRREAEIMARLKHPNTVQLYEYGETPDGLAVMVLELLEGLSLSDRLKAGGTLSVAETLLICEEVASSLAEAHLATMVHRDLKPANIFLAEVAGQVHAKVLDFGIARVMDEEATRLTSTGQVFGTPRYMSPEQAQSTAHVDARSDLYALGLIIYECIVGQPPFVAQTSIQYLSAHTTQAPPKLRSCAPHAPEALEQLIDACLAKEPADRPATADAVARALAEIRRAVEVGEPARLVLERSARPSAGGGAETSSTLGRTRPVSMLGDGGAATAPSAPSARGSAPSRQSGRLRAAGGAALVVALVVAGWAYLGRSGSAPIAEPLAEPRVEPDAGLLAPPSPDAAQAVAIAPAAEDAGRVDDGPDAGAAALDAQARAERRRPSPDAGAASLDGGSGKLVEKRPVLVTPEPGEKATTGPRTMQIEVADDEDDAALVAKASRCKTSALAGLGRLTVEGCASDCAVLVDELCAGRTPVDGREIPPGHRQVVVVCGDRLVVKKSLKVAEEGVTTLRCR
jgi:tRNA A-37 threonylcarbamoyl transferase component Bud32